MQRKTSGALSQLEAVNHKVVIAVGPRYTPGLEPGAPNIAIEYLVDAFDALSLVDGWRERVREYASAVSKELEYRSALVDRLFSRLRATPARLVEQAHNLCS